MLKKRSVVGLTVVLVCALAALFAVGEDASPDWAMNATIIEACSCPLFCPCYFNSEPAAHHGHEGDTEHFCRFNNVFRVNEGHYGATDLAGAKFWVAGDLGSDLTDGKMDWAALHFDPAVTPEQQKGIGTILGALYPVEWGSFVVGEAAPLEWKADKDKAVARLADGKMGEVVLHRFQGMTDEPTVIHNLRYWGAKSNDGFVMMPNEVEAYRVGDKAFEFKGTNGFMITLDIDSASVAAAASAAGAR